MKMAVSRISLCIILAVLTATCGHSDLPKYQTLGDLRILDVLVDKPEVNPGETVTFTPVLSDLYGSGRAINYTIIACPDPGLAYGADPVCPSSSPTTTTLPAGTVTIPAGADNTYTDAVSSFLLTMPDAAALFAGRTPADIYNGVIYLVQYNIRVADGPAINAFLRVFVSDPAKSPKNRNPSATIALNGTPLLDELTTRTTITRPSGDVNFTASSPLASSESYTTLQPDGSTLAHSEQMLNTWFVTDGEFDYSRTDNGTANKWSPGPKPSGRSSVVVVITRDGRGGSTFKKIVLN